MPMTRSITPEEVRNCKLLIKKGLQGNEIANILGRSTATVCRIRDGAHDFMLVDSQDDTPDDSRVDRGGDIMLQSIDNRLYCQNEDMKKVIDQMTGLSTALVELKSEAKRCATYLSAMADALKMIEMKSQQAAPEAPSAKYPGKDFEKWGEVIRRVEVYGDKFIADNLRGTKASLDGVTLYLACTPSAKKFLKSSAVAIPRIKQQCRNVIGYGVEVKIIDL